MVKSDSIIIDEIESKMMDETRPYTEINEIDGFVIRTFDSNYPEHLFKWHFDEETRIVTPLSQDTDWKFQFDNKLPFLFNKTVIIPKGSYHRLIKGSGEFTVKIERS